MEMQGKTRLAIFDFDATLVNTPGPEEGKARYLAATGEKWPHAGWWGRPESLKPPVFNAEPEALHQHVLEDFRKAKADPSTLTVLLTGRHGGQEKEVARILSQYGLEPDEQYYQGHKNLTDHPSYPKGKQNTWDYKHHVVRDRLLPRGGIVSVEMWDDREEHVPEWIKLGQWIRQHYSHMEKIAFHYVMSDSIKEVEF